MKKLMTAATAALVSLFALNASAADETALKNYAARYFQRCPAGVTSLQPIAQAGPAGFQIYAASVKSDDEYCNSQKFLLYSPKTQQVIIGGVIALPEDSRPVNQRLQEHVSQLLKKDLKITINPFPLPDGLRAVSMRRDTDFGPFTYHGYLDSSERFLIVGLRGALGTDVGKTLVEALGPEAIVWRGNAKAKTTVIELSDFECPSCGKAHLRLEPMISKNLDKIRYGRMDLPLFEAHKWAMQAALGARAIQKVAPAKYWEYVDTTFKNQETLETQPFDTYFRNFCDDRDINWNAVEKLYHSGAERQALLDQAARAFDAGIFSTPTLIMNGQMVGFGEQAQFMAATVAKAIGVPTPPAPAAKPAAAKSPAKKK